jgi:HlyD family secretion protein
MAENSKRKRTLLIILSAGLAVVVVVILASRRKDPTVPVANVTREDLNETITSNGKAEPVSPVVARAEFPTFVSKVSATEGQAIRRGQVVLSLNDTEVRSQLEQARADLLAAQNDLRNAHAGGPPDEVAQLGGDLAQEQIEVKNLERTEKALERLVAKQAATEDELAQNRASLTKARANLEQLEQRKKALAERATVAVSTAGLRVSQAQGQIRSLEEKVRSATIVAAGDGILYSLPVRAGDYVKVGDVLAEMADLRHLRVRAFVDEPDLGSLEPNQDVEVSWDARPGRTWPARTEQIPKQVVSHGMRSVGEVLCSIDNEKLELLPNINVEVRILVRERRGALVVPRAAAREDQGRHYVFVFDGEKIHRRDVSLGVANASKYEVLSGLAAGERVALPGDQDLRDGMNVRAAGAN